MRSDSDTAGQGKSSFIEEARRRQIVETAIRTIATRGYSQASLAEIARRAGISKGVISYHFEGKEELVAEILSRLLREPTDFIKNRVDAADRAMDRLRAYVTANFEFMKTHRDNYVALVDLWESRASGVGKPIRRRGLRAEPDATCPASSKQDTKVESSVSWTTAPWPR